MYIRHIKVSRNEGIYMNCMYIDWRVYWIGYIREKASFKTLHFRGQDPDLRLSFASIFNFKIILYSLCTMFQIGNSYIGIASKSNISYRKHPALLVDCSMTLEFNHQNAQQNSIDPHIYGPFTCVKSIISPLYSAMAQYQSLYTTRAIKKPGSIYIYIIHTIYTNMIRRFKSIEIVCDSTILNITQYGLSVRLCLHTKPKWKWLILWADVCECGPIYVRTKA